MRANMDEASRVTPAGWKRVDLHLHTSFSGWRSLRLIHARDCHLEPEDAFDLARGRGMDYVCFTDHNTIEGALHLLSRRPEEEPRVIIGEEVETSLPGMGGWIHVNVFDVDEALHRDLARLRANALELIAELTARDVLFSLNHPFQSFRSVRGARRALATLLPLFPAIEVANSASPAVSRAVLEAMLRRDRLQPKALLGGSDAHTPRRVAATFTAAPGRTKSEFLDSVRRGHSAIGGSPMGMRALIRDVYAAVGAHYRELYSARCPLEGRARLESRIVSTLLLPASLGGLPAFLTAAQALLHERVARFGRWAEAAIPAASQEVTTPAGDGLVSTTFGEEGQT
jgi:predicted metal-dependent phosphoesterase TrpH